MHGSLHVIIRDRAGTEVHRATHDVDDVDLAIGHVLELAPKRRESDAPPSKKQSHAKKTAPADRAAQNPVVDVTE